jgi:hypothetical protein
MDEIISVTITIYFILFYLFIFFFFWGGHKFTGGKKFLNTSLVPCHVLQVCFSKRNINYNRLL